MNLILLEAEELPESAPKECQLTLTGRRHRHILSVHRAEIGATLQVGVINGPVGQGRVTQINGHKVSLHVTLDSTPPPPLPVTLLLALPRPKMLRRILQTAATLGVERLYLINSYRVEKSYWQSPFLQPPAIREQLILGLEQARATHLPAVQLKKRFKPFIEDELPALIQGLPCWVAHPAPQASAPAPGHRACAAAIGPEGGFIAYELEQLEQVGFQRLSLGPRILRVETALPVLMTRLFHG